MQPDAIVITLDELLDVSAKVLQIAISVGVDLFPLEGAHEALAAGVVVRIGGPAHAGYHSLAGKQLHILPACILAAAIGVVHQARQGLPLRDGLLKRGHRQLCCQAAPQRPAHHLTRPGVQHHGQIDELGAQADIGDVSHP